MHTLFAIFTIILSFVPSVAPSSFAIKCAIIAPSSVCHQVRPHCLPLIPTDDLIDSHNYSHSYLPPINQQRPFMSETIKGLVVYLLFYLAAVCNYIDIIASILSCLYKCPYVLFICSGVSPIKSATTSKLAPLCNNRDTKEWRKS